MSVGAQIKKLRKQAKMTQPELAEKLGVHETTIRRWEQGKDRGPDVSAINSIAEIFHTTPDFLLSDVSDMENNVFEDISEKESLVYEWGGGHKLKLPNTRKFKRI